MLAGREGKGTGVVVVVLVLVVVGLEWWCWLALGRVRGGVALRWRESGDCGSGNE
jgi:hypothetical protein